MRFRDNCVLALMKTGKVFVIGRNTANQLGFSDTSTTFTTFTPIDSEGTFFSIY
jgi:alpha-tubulin suppressor-like RCC1 family protein